MSKVAKIIFRQKKANDDDLMHVYDIVNHLYWNGQITEDFIVEDEDTRFKVTAVLTSVDALEERYWPEEIKKYLDNLDMEVIIGNGETWDCDDNCSCEESSFYLLNVFPHPIKCGDCLEAVALFRLAELSCEDRYEMVYFKKLYNTIENLGEYDLEYNKAQLNDPNSKLTNLGLEICKKITSKIHVPVYYYLLTDKNVDKCPKCGGKLDNLPFDITKYSEYGNIDKVCKKCGLVFFTNKKEV